MDSATKLKRKRTSSLPTTTMQPHPQTPGTEAISAFSVPDDDDSTDFKLALLSSVLPDYDQSVLLDILLECDGDVEKATAWLSRTTEVPNKKIGTVGHQTSLAGFVTGTQENGRPKTLSKKGRTLHLYSPEDIANHTPCSIIHNFLPAQIANDLLVDLLEESKTYECTTFKLFDNVVQSPHTSCFYVGSYEEMQAQKTE
jgi:hypothetical protein